MPATKFSDIDTSQPEKPRRGPKGPWKHKDGATAGATDKNAVAGAKSKRQPKPKAAADTKKPNRVIKPGVDYLHCILTPSEVEAKGRLLASLETRLRQIKLEAKSEADKFKRQQSETLSQIDEITAHINSGKEPRNVKIEEVTDYDVREFFRRRLDTSEEYDRRHLRNDELQTKFGFANDAQEEGGEDGND